MLVLRIFLLSLVLSVSTYVHAEKVNRDILVLYFGSEDKRTIETPVHRYLELPLNHLGFHLRYWDVEKGLPTDQMMGAIYGILTWFHGKKFEKPSSYADWLVRQLKNNKKYVFFGTSNLVENTDGDLTSITKVNEVMNLLGLERKDEWVNKHEVQKYTFLNAFAEKFERQVEQEKIGFYLQRAIDPQAKVWVRGRFQGGGSSDLVMTTSKGACALEGHFLFIPEGEVPEGVETLYTYATQWRIDPIRFLREAFDDGCPIPDLTTRCGKRLAFVHIDGDGWNNLSEASKGLTSSELVLTKILRPQKNIHFTIGPIASDLDPEWGGTEKAQKTLSDIAALPQVEIANHTYSHPQIWDFYQQKRDLPEERKKEDPPRGNLKKPFDINNEVQGALKEISKYIPTNKPIKLYLWSGDCLPFKAVLDHVKAAGLFNLNGGANRFDAEFPSLTGISPFYRQVGSHIQVYSAGNNEESYTYGWSERFFGLKYFTKTLRNTEYPYRVKPMNLYFNMFTGQKHASLQAAIQVLNYMKRQNVFWCFASDYAAQVSAFPEVRIEKIGISHWRIHNRKGLNTFRFDLATDKTVDIGGSKGVLGMRHLSGSLYVALNPDEKIPEIKIIESNNLSPRPLSSPYLLYSTSEIRNVSYSKPHFSCDVKGLGEGEIAWIVPYHGQYKVSLGGEGKGIYKTDAEHKLTIPLSSEGLEYKRLDVNLHKVASAGASSS